MNDWRPLTAEEKLESINAWLKKRWSDDFKKGETTEDQSVDYYFYLGRKSTVEDLRHHIDFVLGRCAYVEIEQHPENKRSKEEKEQ